MRLNLATISLPKAATDTYEGNSPTGRLQGALRWRIPNQAFDAATVLDLSLSSSSTPAETASRASRHRASKGPAPVCNLTLLVPAWSDCPDLDRYCLAATPYPLSSSRKSPPLRLHLLHPIPSFRSGEHQSLPANFTSSSSCGTPLSSVRHSRFEYRGRLVAPESANYVYVPEVRRDTASNRPVAVPCRCACEGLPVARSIHTL